MSILDSIGRFLTIAMGGASILLWHQGDIANAGYCMLTCIAFSLWDIYNRLGVSK